MKRLAFLLVVLLPVTASAQLVEPNQLGLRMGHVHLPSDIPAIKAWYVKVFGANPGRRPCVACIANPQMIEADDLPGVNLSFSPARMPPQPTKGPITSASTWRTSTRS
jgi:hypothetical protein